MNPYLLPQVIERACVRWPEQCAVIDGEGAELSYADLERRSRALAAQLQAAGCARGARVGVWLPKSTPAVVALLAILRAGCMYVPLDPWAPPARIEALAADCGLGALLTGAAGAALARQWSSPPALCWDWEHGALPATAATAWQPPANTSDELAYILYTSGSTGVPKGVMLTHAHALNFIHWAADEVGLHPGDRVASHAPFHFDLSIFDLWATLSRGATVCLLDAVTARFPRAVAAWIDQRHITVWYSVPSALVQMLPHAAAAGGRLRAVVFAGEVFPAAALRAWRAALPHAAFHNWFGPTETNVCTHFALPALAGGADGVPDPMPIGYACPNFELAVRDEAGDPVPADTPGFLWARGPGILAGYWG
ncbi:MAG: AMP-binding protein, partial [Terriglobales bacterium]